MIRPMREEDAPAVADLSGQLGYPTTPARIAQRLALIGGRPDNALFVAEDVAGNVAGWVHVYGEHLLESEFSHAEIGGLVVDENARGNGVGRALTQAAEEWAAAQGYAEVRVRSGSVRTGAHAFYQRLGYEVVKTQVRFRKSLRP